MQPVTAEVAVHACEIEASRIPSSPVARLDHHGTRAAIAGEPQRRAKTGRSRAENGNVRKRHGARGIGQ